MTLKMFTSLLVLGLVFLQLPVAFAEDRKSLKELLFDKGMITKDEAADVQEAKVPKWVERITLSGDFRLRFESFMRDSYHLDRQRERFRLRFGPEIRINDFVVGIRLASGTGEQVSTNQSLDNLFSQKAIWIDRAYLKWQGADSRWLTLAGGKMANPFFTVYSTDAVWDDDLSPEGFAENFNLKPGNLTLFLNVGQFVLDEDGTDNNDQWLFGEQVGVVLEPIKDVKTTLAAAYYDFTNTNKGNFGQTVCQSGNTPACAGTPATRTLLNDYNVLDVTAHVGLKAGTIPLAVMGDFVKNLAQTTTNGLATGTHTGNVGYQAGFILGKASDPMTWEFAYFYKVLETDATVADLSDSDFGEGGTDRRGHIVWGAYNLTQYLQFKTKYFKTTKESQTGVPSSHDDIDRLQVDLVMKF